MLGYGCPAAVVAVAGKSVVGANGSGKWLISSRLDSNPRPLRVGVVEDPSGKTVARITVQEGDGLDEIDRAGRQGLSHLFTRPRLPFL
jgi:hypothetical protein